MTAHIHLELSDIELGQIIEAVTVRCSETHRAAPNYSDELFEIIVKLKSALLCPAPVVPSDDGRGASLSLAERNPDDFKVSPTPEGYYVDANNCLMPIPKDAFHCEYCELAQLDDAVEGDFCKCVPDVWEDDDIPDIFKNQIDLFDFTKEG